MLVHMLLGKKRYRLTWESFFDIANQLRVVLQEEEEEEEEQRAIIAMRSSRKW